MLAQLSGFQIGFEHAEAHPYPSPQDHRANEGEGSPGLLERADHLWQAARCEGHQEGPRRYHPDRGADPIRT